jgi:hypothetical protein
MEVGQGPKLGCSAKGKKTLTIEDIVVVLKHHDYPSEETYHLY